MISLTVSLKVAPGHVAEFLDVIKENALRSVTDEPGCHQFDVSQSADDDHHFTLYERYADEAALEAHRNAPHFATWRAAAERLVVTGSQVNVVGRIHVHRSGEAS
jgi:autoinducer 2-degrading protein